jgi:hypothetical protein
VKKAMTMTVAIIFLRTAISQKIQTDVMIGESGTASSTQIEL